ncbi:unnamed protein product [Spirodela intermedia]|uniref:Uncharacterized protein n=1 Tax=Spirodela intermedia TaxID=51605 RepID=A0A7I8JK26_SPIIN|nr:unnamed protein product [Spirodela intermedia]CAA6670420.1 unnamed protein product [Spirodela intermedia]
MALTHGHGGGSPPAEQQPVVVINNPLWEGVAPPPLGEGEEGRRIYQGLAFLLITVMFALLVVQPPQPVGSQLLFECYAASIFVTLYTGMVLLLGFSVGSPIES